MELASISVKLLVDVLVKLGRCNSVDDVPAQINRLLQICNKRSDQAVEQEILDRFLRVTKTIIDDQVDELNARVRQTLDPSGRKYRTEE